MTDKYLSEGELFDNKSDQEQEEARTDTQRKRVSFGPRLPVRMSNSDHSRSGSEAERTPATTSAGAGPSTRGGGGVRTVLGSALGGKTNLDGLTLHIDIDGKDVEYNIWSSIIRGTNARALHKFVTAVSRTDVFDGTAFIENITYQGFDREFFILNSLRTISVSMFVRFAILGAIRGSNFTKIVDSSIEVPADMIALHNTGLIVKKAKKRTDMTILRFTASVPQWCCYWMHSAEVDKKISSEECPGWLQFPGAASLPMGEDLRRQHLSFSIAFSKLLPGGSFNTNIYLTAYSNMIPLTEVPDALRMALGVTTMADAKVFTREAIIRYADANAK